MADSGRAGPAAPAAAAPPSMPACSKQGTSTRTAECDIVAHAAQQHIYLTVRLASRTAPVGTMAR